MKPPTKECRCGILKNSLLKIKRKCKYTVNIAITKMCTTILDYFYNIFTKLVQYILPTACYNVNKHFPVYYG